MARARFAKLETDIEGAVCDKAFKGLGIRNIKVNTQTETGWPDRMFLIPGGAPLLIEFKRPGEPPRRKQEIIRDRLISLGYRSVVCDNEEDAIAAIRKAIAETRP
jgi:hypothetical protein